MREWEKLEEEDWEEEFQGKTLPEKLVEGPAKELSAEEPAEIEPAEPEFDDEPHNEPVLTVKPGKKGFYENLTWVISSIRDDLDRYKQAYFEFTRLMADTPLRNAYIANYFKESLMEEQRLRKKLESQKIQSSELQKKINLEELEEREWYSRPEAKAYASWLENRLENIRAARKSLKHCWSCSSPIFPWKSEYLQLKFPHMCVKCTIAETEYNYLNFITTTLAEKYHLSPSFTYKLFGDQKYLDAYSIENTWKSNLIDPLVKKLLSSRLGLPKALISEGLFRLFYHDHAVSEFANLLYLVSKYKIVSKKGYERQVRQWHINRESAKINALHQGKSPPQWVESNQKFHFSGIYLKYGLYSGQLLYQIYLKFGWPGVETVFKTQTGSSNILNYFLNYAPAKAKFKELVKIMHLMRKFYGLSKGRLPLKILRLLPKVGSAGRLAAVITGGFPEIFHIIGAPLLNLPQRYSYELWLEIASKLRYTGETIDHIFKLGIGYDLLTDIFKETISKKTISLTNEMVEKIKLDKIDPAIMALFINPDDLDKYVKNLTSLAIIARELYSNKQRNSNLGKALIDRLHSITPYLHKISQKIHLFVKLKFTYWNQTIGVIAKGKFPSDSVLISAAQLEEWNDANYWSVNQGEIRLNKRALQAKWEAELSEIQSQPITADSYKKKKEILQKLEENKREDHLFRLRDRRAQEDPIWATEQYPNTYRDGKFLAPLYTKILEALRKIPGPLVIHGRDGETIYQVAKSVDPQLFERMIYVLSSRPLTTETSSHSPQYLAYLNALINKEVPMVHIDTGFAGSIPLWFRSHGWNVKDIKLISSNTLEYGLLGSESLNLELRTIVLDKIEHIKHRLIQATPDIWGQWIYSYDAPAFWVLVRGIVDGMKELTEVRKNPSAALSSTPSLQELFDLSLMINE